MQIGVISGGSPRAHGMASALSVISQPFSHVCQRGGLSVGYALGFWKASLLAGTEGSAEPFIWAREILWALGVCSAVLKAALELQACSVLG